MTSRAYVGLVLTLTILAPVSTVADCLPRLRPLRDPVHLDAIGPQGITRDADGHFWVSHAITMEILELTNDLEPAGVITAEVPRVDNPFGNGFAGITYNAEDDTLFVCRTFTKEIWEIRKDGSLTGNVILLNLPPPLTNLIPEPAPKGIAYDPSGDGGNGSFWLVETVTTAVYEVNRFGEIINSFCHPDDPDGCPGEGLAARSNQIGLFQGPSGLELEIVGGERFRDRVHRVTLDGVRTGITYPLGEIGGRPGGFYRDTITPRGGGDPIDVFYVTTESGAELHVLEIVEGEQRPPLELVCDVSGSADDVNVDLRWRNTDDYDEIEVRRDRAVLATLPGNARRFVDEAPPDGILNYEIIARSGACESTLSCTRLVGPGRVLATAEVDDRRILDVTEDADGLLWTTTYSNEITVFSKDLEQLFEFPSPFLTEDDITSGIAFNPASDPRNPTVFLYNLATNLVGEMDGTGEFVDSPFPSGMPSTEERPAIVKSMLFNPDGDGGSGTFFYVDNNRGTIEERTRGGELVRGCVHPDWIVLPPPPGARGFWAYIAGLAEFPGTGFSELLLPGGSVRDGRTTRFLSLDMKSCESTGRQIPAADILERLTIFFPSVHLTTHDERPTLVVIDSNSSPRSWLFRAEAGPIDVPLVADLRCAQPDEAREVELSWIADGALDGIELLRDGQVIATLPGDARQHVDRDVLAGRVTYTVRGRLDGVTGDDRSCSLDVGPGAIARSSLAHPALSLTHIAYDPVNEVYVAPNPRNPSRTVIYRYDRDLAFRDQMPHPITFPREIAALAVRVRPGGNTAEYLCLVWDPGESVDVAPGEPAPSLPLVFLDPSGNELRRIELEMPEPEKPTRAFPSGLAWDSSDDSIWLLDRNAARVVNYTPDGTVLRSFPHPAPLHQDRVFNYGIAVSGLRGTIYLSTAGRFDYRITRLVELTRGGELTGFEIPTGVEDHDPSKGFTLTHEEDRVVFMSVAEPGGFPELVERRLHDPVAPISNLECVRRTESAAPIYELTWMNEAAYDELVVHRGTEIAATLEGSATGWTDESPPETCSLFYRVEPRMAGVGTGPGIVCEADAPTAFLRGDVEENGELNISDAVVVLGFLFLGGDDPACFDAADIDDSGSIEITDAVKLLNFLFLSGSRPAAPYPLPGCDPSEDGLGCER